ncbi:MAG: glycerol-3-phosphate dehydrogenase (NAD(P)+) [Bacteroidia bacterium]|jgi:glycerol-3-phosphate dehydrogenase (NAD(P)+)
MSEKGSVGVIGAGSFGTAIANILSGNRHVYIYSRTQEVVDSINSTRMNRGKKMEENITATNSLEEVAVNCELIFPIVASHGFRDMIRKLSPYLHPNHMLIHGTKGLDVQIPEGDKMHRDYKLDPKKVYTMSEIILEETLVRRVGCLAGPNLAAEILEGQPAATVVASRFDEVIRAGQKALKGPRFQAYSSKDLIGVEIAGVLKNIIAIAAGALSGLGYGENAKAMLISRGMIEMIHIGKILGGDVTAFLGLAGVGDLIATCSSPSSRNFTVGYRIAQGESLQQILESMEEVAEGVNTLRIAKGMSNYLGFRAPLTETCYTVAQGDKTVQEGLDYLMKFPYLIDIDPSMLDRSTFS